MIGYTDPTATTLVIGVGNRILSDEGVGVHIIERLLAAYNIPEDVLLLDGGTLGLDLLYYLKGVKNLLLVDAVELRKDAGTLVRMVNDEVPAFLSIKMSPHQVGIPDMLAVAKMKDLYPENVILWGVEPDSLEIGMDLSPTVEARVPVLIDEVLKQLEAWGHKLQPKLPAVEKIA
ncbi:MAG: HyaD/HybD family hydrogenase maturation endopeptidase [Chloroflexi bacterium]|nr:HyaD/HybD family hydrogenase maturation endopeptidase [Chloroflexota bacterium]